MRQIAMFRPTPRTVAARPRWVRMQLIGLCALAGLLGGCFSNPDPPIEPGSLVAWTHLWPNNAVRQVRVEYPNNWKIEASRHGGGSVTMSGSELEWWRLAYHPEFAGKTAGQIFDTLRASELANKTDVLSSDRVETTINDRPAIACVREQIHQEWVGGRVVVDGGWIIEWQSRPAYQSAMVGVFHAATASLDITDN